MRMWFCSSGFGPGPSYPGGGSKLVNGAAGPTISRKKNEHTTNSVSITHAIIGSSPSLRNFRITATT